MSDYSNWQIVKSFRQGFYEQSAAMMPYQFKEHYQNIPIYVPSGKTMRYRIGSNYQSKYSSDRKTHALALRKKIESHYGEHLDESLRKWLYSKRLASCFSGHGSPEEISMIASYAVYSGYKSEGELTNWMPKVFGLDCNGFASAYFTAIKTFQKPMYYIPKFPMHAGYALEENEITYDGVICFARHKMKTLKGVDEDGDGKDDRVETKDWEVRPNPGNGAHIMVIDCWAQKPDALWVTQMSATYGLDTHRYDIIGSPAIKKKRRAAFVIRRRGLGKKYNIDVMFSKRMPSWIGSDGGE